MTKSFFIDQHGCAKNQTDGELITGFLIDAGYDQTFDAEKADLIIINSCGFIESAKKESIDAIYNVKAAYPNAKIILAGCLAERYSELMYDSIPELDGIIGNGDLSQIVQVVKQELCQFKQVIVFSQNLENMFQLMEVYLMNAQLIHTQIHLEKQNVKNVQKE